MKATTIKLEGELLKNLTSFCPADVSISAFVRNLLSTAVKKQKMLEAAKKYQAFLEEHPEEKTALELWQEADLEKPIKLPRKKK